MQQERLIRLSEVKRRTGLSRSTIYANIKNGTFPKQCKPSVGVSAWKESDINAFIEGVWHNKEQ